MRSIIVDERISEGCERALSRLGLFVMKLSPCSLLPSAIRSHPDSLIFKYGKRLFTYASYAEEGLSLFSDVREYHGDHTLTFLSDEPSDKYPEDCKLNALVINNMLFAREKSLCAGIKTAAERDGLKIINTKQGYPACSTLKIGESHAITADKGLARTLSEEGISTLLISEGGITLPPYEYGFIGGASFVYSGTVYFFGEIDRHADARRIREFIEKAGYKIKSLTDEPLADLGGAILLD